MFVLYEEEEESYYTQSDNIHVSPDADLTDGLAAAVCHFYNNESISIDKKYSGWSSYIKNNPKKIN